MSSQELSTTGLGRSIAWRLAIGVAITLVFLVLVIGPGNLGYLGGMAAAAHPHAPRWDLLAKAGIADIRRGDGRATLLLKDGSEAPVSRTHAKALRQAGWL